MTEYLFLVSIAYSDGTNVIAHVTQPMEINSVAIPELVARDAAIQAIMGRIARYQRPNATVTGVMAARAFIPPTA